MPELPEVETIMHGLTPHIEGGIIEHVVIRHHQLRWPIDIKLNDYLKKAHVVTLSRRGKYLLINTDKGTLSKNAFFLFYHHKTNRRDELWCMVCSC